MASRPGCAREGGAPARGRAKRHESDDEDEHADEENDGEEEEGQEAAGQEEPEVLHVGRPVPRTGSRPSRRNPDRVEELHVTTVPPGRFPQSLVDCTPEDFCIRQRGDPAAGAVKAVSRREKHRPARQDGVQRRWRGQQEEVRAPLGQGRRQRQAQPRLAVTVEPEANDVVLDCVLPMRATENTEPLALKPPVGAPTFVPSSEYNGQHTRRDQSAEPRHHPGGPERCGGKPLRATAPSAGGGVILRGAGGPRGGPDESPAARHPRGGAPAPANAAVVAPPRGGLRLTLS